MDSVRKETYEAQRAGGKLEDTLTAMDYLLERKRRSDSAFPLIHVGMILTRLNEGQIEEFVAFWRKRFEGLRGVGICSAWGHNFNGKVEEENLLKPRSGMYLNRPCAHPFHMALIQSSGEICLCCLDAEGETSVGNLKEMTLHEAWHSEKATRLRAEMKRAAYRLNCCMNCEAKRFYPVDGRLKSAEYLSYAESTRFARESGEEKVESRK